MPITEWSLIFLNGTNIRVLSNKSTVHLKAIQSCALSSATAPGVCLLLEPMCILLLWAPGSTVPLSEVRPKVWLDLNNKIWPYIIYKEKGYDDDNTRATNPLLLDFDATEAPRVELRSGKISSIDFMMTVY